MPRGKRKTGQFNFTLWFPDGFRIQIESIKDLPRDEWISATRKHITRMKEWIDKVEARQEKEIA